MKLKRLSLILALVLLAQLTVPLGASADAVSLTPENNTYAVPVGPNVDYNMNYDWKFKLWEGNAAEDAKAVQTAMEAIKTAGGGKDFFATDFNDNSWETVSVPHNYSDNMLFDELAAGAGDGGNRGIAFYRKHFTLSSEHAGKKFLLEFEGIRQAAFVWVNGNYVGSYEAGVDPFGMDISQYVKCDGSDNVIALVNDGTSGRGMTNYHKETRPNSNVGERDGAPFQWNSNDFNPTVAGLTRDVILHVKNPVYQTLPLYSNLKTMGAYVYGSDFDVANKSATITVEAEVRNESDSAGDLSIEVAVVDQDGKLWYSFASDAVNVDVASDKGKTYPTVVPSDAYETNPKPTDTSTVDVSKIVATARVSGLHLWSTMDPFLYNVYSILKDDSGNVLDVTQITTGFRKLVTKGGTDGGVYVNDELVWLTGYAQRATNEWAAIGSAPDWMRDWDMSMVRESNANFIRWMHIAAQPVDIRAGDKYGVACAQPAGDKEGEPTIQPRQWDQRVEAMRDTIIYFRNSPSIFFWEAGNSFITAEHMREMTALRKELDPHNGRTMGCRALSDDQDAVDAAEYVGTMLGRKVEDDSGFTGNGAMTRDKKAIVECEYYREEAPRRVWDDYSPPDYDYKHGGTGAGDSWDMNAEDFVVQSAGAYMFFYGNRVNSNSSRPIYSAAAALCWTDSTQHGRNTETENARMSGRVDPARIKKQSFYAYQVLQSTTPMIYLVGHWNYPTDVSAYQNGRDPYDKTVYVLASHCKYVELWINGQYYDTEVMPTDSFVYAFQGVDITKCTPGSSIEAKSYDSKGNLLASHKIETAGEPASIRLTPHTGPNGFLADGSDVAYVDVEIVDAQGRIVPLDYSELNLSISGPATLRGGYNSGGQSTSYGNDKVNVLTLNQDPTKVRAECGTNRIFLRAGQTSGTVTLTVSRSGLPDATVSLTTKTVSRDNGLSTQAPQTVQPDFDVGGTPAPEPTATGMVPVLDPLAVSFGENGNAYEVAGDIRVKKEIKIYLNGSADPMTFENGTSGTALVAYLMADSVFGPVNTFATACGATVEGNMKSLTITWNNQTVRLDESLMTYPNGGTEIINQMAEPDDGVLHAQLDAIAKGFGWQYTWNKDKMEFRVTVPTA